MSAPAESRTSSLVGRSSRFATASDRLLLTLFVLYLVWGKGFAYFGIPPLFIGEVALVVALAAIVRPGMTVPSGSAPACAALFVVAGTAQFLGDVLFTDIPLVETARGFALVYYATFAVLVHAALTNAEQRHGFTGVVAALERTLQRALPWILVGLLFLALRLVIPGIPSPTWPRSGVPMLFTKSTDVSVALSFALPLVVDRSRRHAAHARLLAGLWIAATLMVTARSRAGVLAIVIAVLLTFGVRAVYVIRGVMVIVGGYVLLMVSDFSLRVGSRELSATGLRNSVIGVFAPEQLGEGNFAGTTRWRTEWWKTIWHDVEARGLWFRSNGWGTNLASKYLAPGYVPDTAFTALRLPHNTVLSIAGRAGVLAAALYLAVPATTYLSSRRRSTASSDSSVLRAFQVSLLSGVVVGLTDVYIESPQGGIVLWCGCGVLWWWARQRTTSA